MFPSGNIAFKLSVVAGALLLLGGYFLFFGTLRAPIVFPGEEICVVKARPSVKIYMRPSLQADVFGEASDIEDIRITARTEEGWLGFEPGVAQAPNVGPFRLRYLPPNGDYEKTGECGRLPLVATVAPDTCYVMTHTDTTNVYRTPEAGAEVVTTIPAMDYVPATGRRGSEANQWIRVDARSKGGIPFPLTGWISSDEVDFNGRTCDALPVSMERNAPNTNDAAEQTGCAGPIPCSATALAWCENDVWKCDGVPYGQ